MLNYEGCSLYLEYSLTLFELVPVFVKKEMVGFFL